jgi:hypothetical protein
MQTDNTNQGELELYSILGEYDNAGYPLAYMLLSTATSIADHKRTMALAKFLEAVRDKYNVHPRFNHVDKDFAEIAALQAVWPGAKRQICWWHLKRAMNQRMAKAKLSTTPYNPADARAEFPFVDLDFVPTTAADPKEDEEYAFDAGERKRKRKKKTKQNPPTEPPPAESLAPDFIIKLPSLTVLRKLNAEKRANGDLQEDSDDDSSDDDDTPTEYDDDDDLELNVQPTKRQFCPEGLRNNVIAMVERHYCAHPDIPGMARPDATGIRMWAVKQIYEYCKDHDLRELWAYLWGNWYRTTRWELWARSSSAEIPRLKTNMICESQYVFF